ncbi:MAG TPA: hypothetical protein VFU71_19605 [Burkholderiaceae bacterium]|nr:hypothetical protein [Burkholderiaceae bacterium]
MQKHRRIALDQRISMSKTRLSSRAQLLPRLRRHRRTGAARCDVLRLDARLSGASVESVHAVVSTLGWQVFVDLPVAEARAPLWGTLIRVRCMLGLAIVAALLARVIAARRATPVLAAPV